jgi:hypothetical protein
MEQTNLLSVERGDRVKVQEPTGLRSDSLIMKAARDVCVEDLGSKK